MGKSHIETVPKTPGRQQACGPVRLYAAGALLAGLVVMVLAWRLAPAAAGRGTHQQIGLPACGFVDRTGYPCPTCGMTTAFAWTARGRWLLAWRTQPAGAILAGAVIVGLAVSAVAVVTGRWPEWLRRHWARLIPAAGAIVLSGWGWLVLQTYLTHR